MAEVAQAAHESTLGYACHELRNPLHAISASAAFLVDVITQGSPGYEDLLAILAGAEQMHRIVNDVLDLGKLRAGKLALKPEPFQIRCVTLSECLSCVCLHTDSDHCASVCRDHGHGVIVSVGRL